MRWLSPIAVLLFAPASFAQQFNEIYARHFGPDDQEFVEIEGPSGLTLDGHMVLTIDGDQPVNGTLLAAWDLTGFSIPFDAGGRGYFVAGDAGVANVDLAVPGANIHEGTITVLLAFVGNPAAVQALIGTNVDTDGDYMVDIDSLANTSVQVLDAVALVDSGYPIDVVYDNAHPVGPGQNGVIIPSGIFREGDYPNPWCPDVFLDPDDVANVDQPRSPGAPNTALCQSEPGSGQCFGVGCPCANDDPTAGCANSTGSGALLSGSGSRSVGSDSLVLTASNVPMDNNGLFYMGDTVVSNAFFDGFQCALGTTFRFLPSIQNSGASGTMTFTGWVAASGGLITAGSTWHFHCWFRDPTTGPCGTGANLTNLYSVTFTP